ncbi:MAG TPA: hypothetical protein VHC22_34025 [Pirellulales bacterium]|nr:hypothetical protein [Pirellulales bacterium]
MAVIQPSQFTLAASLTALALAGTGLGAMKIWRNTPLGQLSGGIAVLVGVVLALTAIGRHVLGPLDAAARHRRRPTQFTMADFLALMFLFQLPVALIRLVIPYTTSGVGLVYGFAWIASLLMWGTSVQTLSRAGIQTPWRRVVFLSAVLPIAYFGSVAFVATILFGAGAVLFDGAARAMKGWPWLIAIGITMPFAFYWAARFVRSMVIHSQSEEEPCRAMEP